MRLLRLYLKLCRLWLKLGHARLRNRLLRFLVRFSDRRRGVPPEVTESRLLDAVMVADCVPKRERDGVFEQMARPGRN